jgi:hypothetical protein
MGRGQGAEGGDRAWVRQGSQTAGEGEHGELWCEEQRAWGLWLGGCKADGRVWSWRLAWRGVRASWRSAHPGACGSAALRLAP